MDSNDEGPREQTALRQVATDTAVRRPSALQLKATSNTGTKKHTAKIARTVATVIPPRELTAE
jgi:hypothetical protein